MKTDVSEALEKTALILEQVAEFLKEFDGRLGIVENEVVRLSKLEYDRTLQDVPKKEEAGQTPDVLGMQKGGVNQGAEEKTVGSIQE